MAVGKKGYSVGQAHILVRPNLENFRKKLTAGVKAHSRGVKANVGVDVDDRELILFERRVESSRLSLDVKPEVDWERFWTEVKAGMASAQSEMSVNVRANTAKARAEIQALDDRKAHLDVGMSTTGAEARLAAVARERVARIRVAMTGYTEVENKLNALSRFRRIGVDISPDKGFMDNLDRYQRIATRLSVTNQTQFNGTIEYLTRPRVIPVTTKYVGESADANFGILKTQEVSVRLKPEWGRFKRDLAEWTQANRPELTVTVRARTASAAEKIRRLTRDETKTVHVNVNRDKILEAAKSLENRMETLTNAAGRAVSSGAKLSLIGLAASGAVPEVAALSSEIGKIGKISAIAPAIINAFGAIGAAAAISIGGLFGKDSPWEEMMTALGNDDPKPPEGLSEVDKALWGLGETTKTTLKQIGGLRDEFKELQNAGRDALAKGLGEEVEKLTKRYLPDLKQHVAGFNTDFRDMFMQWSRFRRTSQGLDDFNTQMDNSHRLMQGMTRATGYFGLAWNDLATVGSEFLPAMGSWAANVTKDFAEWTARSRENGSLIRDMKDGLRATAGVGKLVGTSLSIVRDVFRASNREAGALADHMRESLEATKEWTSSDAGQSRMADFFHDATRTGDQIMGIFGEIARVFGNSMAPLMAEFMEGFGPAFREVVKIVGGMVDILVPSAESAGRAVGNLLIGMHAWGIWITPIAKEVLPSLTKTLEKLAPALGGLLGPIASLMIVKTVADKFAPFLMALDALAGKRYGGVAIKLSLITGAGIALALAFEPVASLFGSVAKAMVGFNDSLGGIPAKITAIAFAVGMLRSAFKSMGASMQGFADSGRPGSAFVNRLGIAGAAKSFSSMADSVRHATRTLPALRREYALVSAQVDEARKRVKQFEDAQKVHKLGAATANEKFRRTFWQDNVREQEAATKRLNTLMDQQSRLYQQLGGKTRLTVGGMMKSTVSLVGTGMSRATGVVKRGLSGLSAALGGWWSVGIIAAVTAVSSIVDSHKRWNKYLNDSASLSHKVRDSSNEMFSALGSGDSKLQAAADGMKRYREELSQFAQDNKVGVSEKFGTAISGYSGGGGVFGGIGALRRLSQKENDANSAQGLLDEISNRGLSDDELARKLSGSKGAADGFIDSFKPEHRDRLRDFREEIEQMQEKSELLGDSGIKASEAIKKIAAAGEDGKEHIVEFTDALREMNGISLSAPEAAKRLTDNIKSITGSPEQFEGAKWDGKQIDPSANVGSTNAASAMLDLARNLEKSVQAGQDVDEALEQAGQAMDVVAKAAGVTRDELQDAYNVTKEDLVINVGSVNADAAFGELATLRNKMQQVADDETEIKVEVNSEAARDALDAIGLEVKNFDEEQGIATVDISDGEARRKLDELLFEIGQFELRDPKVGLGINASELDQGILDAMQSLGIIEDANPEAVASLNWDSLSFQQKLALAELFRLDQETPTPIADADVKAVLRKMQDSIDKTRELDGEQAKPHVEVTGTENAKSKIQGVLDLLSAISPVVNVAVNVTKTIKEAVVPADLSASKDSAIVRGVQGRFRGGRLPAYSTGGLLPTTGPGTDRVDGFLGVDENGTPLARVNRGEWIINQRSSERYDGVLRAINAGTFPDDLPGYANGGLLDGVSKALGAAGGAIGNAVGALKPPTAPQGGVPGDMFSPVVDSWSNVASTMEGNWSSFVGLADSTWQTVESDASSYWDSMSGSVLSTWDVTESGLADGFSRVVSDTEASFASARDSMSSNYSSAAQAINGVTMGNILPTFSTLEGALGNTVNSFGTGATGIANLWSRVREATASPVRFAIQSVFNDGIVGMWNSAKELLGTPTMNPYPLRFATGGHVQGPGGPTEDKIPALLSDGEYVINAKAVKKIGLQNLNALNSGGVSVAPNAFRSDLPSLMANDMTWNKIASRYASGGPVKGSRAWEQLKRGWDWARSLNGRPYVLGGDPVGGGGTDCSGYMSSIADRIQGGPGHRRWGTMAFNGGGNSQHASGPQGFVKGLSAGFSIGILNGGPANGHTAGTLGGVEGIPAVNVESGGGHGNVAFGGPAVGADHSQFPTRYHLPIIDGAFVSGGAGSFVSMATLVAEAISGSKTKLKNALLSWGRPPGMINLTPPAVGDKLGSAAEKKIMAKAEAMGDVSGGPGVDLSGISGSTVSQVQEVFARAGWTGKEWEDAKWIIGKESGFNPTATNPSSGAYGLFQFNPSSGTQQQYLPSRTSDPARQAEAGTRYIRERYGSPSRARAFWEANGWYAKGGVLPGYTPGKDIHRIPAYMFSGGEAIMRPEFTKLMGGKPGIDALNRAAIAGKLNAISVKPQKDEEGKEIEEQRVFTAVQWDALRRSIEKKSRARDWDGVADDLVLASEVLAEGAARVDWSKVGSDVEGAATKDFFEGQRGELTKLLGFDYDSIPLVKAGDDLKKAIADQNKGSARELDQLKKKRDADDKRLEKQAERDKERAESERDRARREADNNERKARSDERDKAVKAGSLSKEEAKAQREREKRDRERDTQLRKAEQAKEKAERDKEEKERRAKERAERAKLDAEYALLRNQAMGVPTLDGLERKAPAFKKSLRRHFGFDWNTVEPTIRRAVADYGRSVDGLSGKVPAHLVSRFTHGRIHFADGGLIRGLGGPREDNIPIMASAGEFVVRHAATQAAKPLLAALNADPALAATMNAAYIMASATGMTPTSSGDSQTVYNYHIHASSVDEGMRRAKMQERQAAAAMSPYR